MVQTSVSSTNGSDLESSESRFHCSNLGRRLVDKKNKNHTGAASSSCTKSLTDPINGPINVQLLLAGDPNFFQSAHGFLLGASGLSRALGGQKRERSSGFRDLLLGAESWL